jgi:hypothetical protein
MDPCDRRLPFHCRDCFFACVFGREHEAGAQDFVTRSTQGEVQLLTRRNEPLVRVVEARVCPDRRDAFQGIFARLVAFTRELERVLGQNERNVVERCDVLANDKGRFRHTRWKDDFEARASLQS